MSKKQKSVFVSGEAAVSIVTIDPDDPIPLVFEWVQRGCSVIYTLDVRKCSISGPFTAEKIYLTPPSLEKLDLLNGLEKTLAQAKQNNVTFTSEVIAALQAKIIQAEINQGAR